MSSSRCFKKQQKPGRSGITWRASTSSTAMSVKGTLRSFRNLSTRILRSKTKGEPRKWTCRPDPKKYFPYRRADRCQNKSLKGSPRTWLTIGSQSILTIVGVSKKEFLRSKGTVGTSEKSPRRRYSKSLNSFPRTLSRHPSSMYKI